MILETFNIVVGGKLDMTMWLNWPLTCTSRVWIPVSGKTSSKVTKTPGKNSRLMTLMVNVVNILLGLLNENNRTTHTRILEPPAL
jgi:hypothetical protein